MVPAARVLFICQLARFTTFGRGDEASSSFLVTFMVNNLGNKPHGGGNFTVEVHPKWAPRGAQRFATLVRENFFDDVTFFRVIPGFMAQFGISGLPATSSIWQHRTMKDDKVQVSNKRGRITYAMGGPGSRTTQMFINFKDNAFLDGQGFAPFGEVVRGMDVVDRLYGGYGEGEPNGNGPAQGKVQQQGNAYLRSTFPRCSYIERALFKGNVTPPVGADDWGAGAFPGDDGIPALVFLIIAIAGSFLFGRCSARASLFEEAAGPQGQVIVHSTMVGSVSICFWIWASMNYFTRQLDLGVFTFLFAFLTSILARYAALGKRLCVVRCYCWLMPLSCIVVAFNYGAGIAAQPEFFTMSAYLAAGLAWWTIAGCCGLALAARLLREAKETYEKMDKNPDIDDEHTVIGTECGL